MPKNKRTNRSPQKPKSRSLDTRAMLLDPRGGRRGQVPSGTVYKKWDGKWDA